MIAALFLVCALVGFLRIVTLAMRALRATGARVRAIGKRVSRRKTRAPKVPLGTAIAMLASALAELAKQRNERQIR